MPKKGPPRFHIAVQAGRSEDEENTSKGSRYAEKALYSIKTLPAPITSAALEDQNRTLRRTSSDKKLRKDSEEDLRKVDEKSLVVEGLQAVARTKFEDDMNDPNRLQLDWRERLKLCDVQCSEITDGLYLGSETVSANLELLKKNGITHILNCAGAICKVYHPEHFQYRVLYLLDGREEDITCLFYDVIDWIENARNSGGRVFIHCQQGVSRSSAMAICYLMWKNNSTFQVLPRCFFTV